MSDDPFPALAVDLKADAEAKRRAPKVEPEVPDSPRATYRQVSQPKFPVQGESWLNTKTGVKLWYDGTGWSMDDPAADTPPELEEQAEDPGQPDEQEEQVQADEDADQASGDGGAAERAHTTAIERLEALEFLPETKSLIDDTRDFVLELFKHRSKPWSQMSEAEQRDTAAAIQQQVETLVGLIVELVAAEGDTNAIRCLLESFVEKDGIKVTLKVKPREEDDALSAIIGLHKSKGKHVVIRVASIEDYRGGRPAETQADQPDLGFEAGTDHYPDDDSDLAGDADEGGDSDET